MWIKNEVNLPPCVPRRDMGVAPDGGMWACAQPSHFIRGGKFLRYPKIWRVDGQRFSLNAVEWRLIALSWFACEM
jgi:hypothetical protein